MISVAVTYLALSEARKSAAWATSQPEPMRPWGCARCARQRACRGGGDVDDGALAYTLHHRQYQLAGEEHVLEIVLHLLIPHSLGHLHRSPGGRAADVVVEHVDPPERFEARRHQGLDHGAALMSAANTLAPSRANSTAVVLPLPQPGPTAPAPVTIATLSSKRPGICRFFRALASSPPV